MCSICLISRYSSSEWLPTTHPGLGPVALDSRDIKAAEVHATEGIGHVADRVVLRPACIDGHEGEPIARRGVASVQNLVRSDKEVALTFEPGLDLDPDRVPAGHLGQDVEARVPEGLLDRVATERAFGNKHC